MLREILDAIGTVLFALALGLTIWILMMPLLAGVPR